MEPLVCTNCASPLSGEFCSRCGERRFEPAQFRMRHFLGYLLRELTDLEHSAVFATARALLLAPGRLTLAYLRGQQRRYIGPVKLFLTLFAVSFFCYSVYQPTAAYDIGLAAENDPSGWLTAAIADIAQKRHLDPASVTLEINTLWQKYISFTQALYPLTIALILELLYLRQRRYFAEHLIFGLHFSSFFFASLVILWPLYAISGLHLGRAYTAVTMGVFLWTFIYILQAIRRVYQQSWIKTTIKGTIAYGVFWVVSTAVSLVTCALALFMTKRG